MSDQNIVVTVRLSDVDEIDQPDPICLPAGELATWRHFEALLQSMYREPPLAIRVCYLDDESDWIEVSSDTELREAIRVAQSTDDILQLQVKRKDAPQDTYFESTLNQTLPTPTSVGSEDSHVTPLHTTYYNNNNTVEQKPILVYPHPPTDNRNTNTHNAQTNVIPIEDLQWRCVYPLPLVYPHPDSSSFVEADTQAPAPVERSNSRPNENVLMMEANGRAAYIQNRPDLSTEEKVNRLKARLSSHKDEDNDLKGLNTCLSFREMFNQASGLSSEEKVKFMKDMVSNENVGKEPKKEELEGSKVTILPGEPGYTCSAAVLIEPLSSTRLAVQDPFEVVCHDQPSRDLEQIQLNLQPGNLLQPEKPRDSTSPHKDMDVRVVEGEAAPPSDVLTSGNPSRPSAASIPPPIPLIHSLQMMVGAQSGANAVAIEIPEGDHHGAAQKEDDVTASGGAACTSASAETGEVINNRTCHDGAAVGDKVKERSANGHSCSSDQATVQPAIGVSGTKVVSKKTKKNSSDATSKTPVKDAEKSKSKKEASSSKEAKKEEKKRLKEKDAICCQHKTSSQEMGCCGGASVKVVADVESGEKIVKKKKSSSKGSMLHTKDFVKLMTKMQTELHTGIVKDVGKQTDKLLKRTFSRSASYESSLSLTHNSENFKEIVHRGIYCDSCNSTIYGIRYKCGNCEDFDYCEKCEASHNNHDQSHVFLKLRQPVTKAGKVEGKNVPLLREIIYKKNSDSSSKEFKKSKIECLEDVPILSISEVTTPGRKDSPPCTPLETCKKTDTSNWVWDSTFDTDKHLYPLEGDSTGSSELCHIITRSPESKEDDLQRLSDSEMTRLYALLSIEAEAARRADRGRENGQDLIVELAKLTSVPEMAESVHSLTALPSTNSAVYIEVNAPPPLIPLPTSTAASAIEILSLEVTDRTTSYESFETAVKRESGEGHDEQPDIDSNQDEDSCSQASSAELVEAEEEEEGEEDFEELNADVDENGGEKHDAGNDLTTNTQPELHSDSDTSDDFCVLDPPSRSDAEELEHEFGDEIDRELLSNSTEVPSMEMVDHVRAEGEAVGLVAEVIVAKQVEIQEFAVEEEAQVVEEKIEAVEFVKSEATVLVIENEAVENKDNDDDDKDKLAEASGGNVEGEEKKVEDDGEDDVVDETSLTQEDVLMNMSAEERCRFLEMVKTLKDRAEDLECQLKIRKAAEAEQEVEKEMEVKYQMILEEKQKEAVRENEKLEQIQKKKELDERSKRQQRLLEKEKERKLRQKKSKELKSTGGSGCGEGAKKKTRTSSSLGSKPTLMQMALNPKDGQERKSSSRKQESTSALSGQGASSTAVQVDNVVYVRSEKKDADCQTNGGGADAAAQASQMMHNVASGVSKAAEAAYHTAKDVFLSLQAKQAGFSVTKYVPYESKSSRGTPMVFGPPPPGIIIPDIDTDTVTSDLEKEDQPAIVMFPNRGPEFNGRSAIVYRPPVSNWVPPASDWAPPVSNWVLPKSDWTGPKSEWTGPKSEWTPPPGYYQPPGLVTEPEAASEVTTTTTTTAGDVGATASTTTITTTTNSSSENRTEPEGITTTTTDDSSSSSSSSSTEKTLEGSCGSSRTRNNDVSISKKEESAPMSLPSPVALPPARFVMDPNMQLLIEMGFANREQNRRLLSEFDGDMEKVVQSILQEERAEGEHWSWQRH